MSGQNGGTGDGQGKVKQTQPGTVDETVLVGERARQLADVPLFSGLAAAELETLAEVSEVVRFEPGARIVEQGEPGSSVYLITEGRVEVLARPEHDRYSAETAISWLAPGDTFGELALLDGGWRSASCVAVTAVCCVRLGREAFLTALQQNWPLSFGLHVMLAQRLRVADQLLAEYARDPLTGLNNRRALADLYVRESERTRRASRQRGGAEVQPLALVFCDVNAFKNINDTYGHAVGDEVLKTVAEVLTSASRLIDVVARFGGDEFVMLLPDSGDQGAVQVIGRVRQRLAEHPGPVPFSLSLGYALVDRQYPQALDELIAEADQAMYRDKAAQGGPAVRPT